MSPRIIDDAFDAMQHSLRLNEDRTAEAIENLARRLEDRRHDNHVREMQSGLERNFGRGPPDRVQDPVSAPWRRRLPPLHPLRPAPAVAEDRHLERQIAALGERSKGLSGM